MEIDFCYEGRPGLKIIQQITNGKIVWVLGYNGVGKSLAAKLLEIISGNHLFASRNEFDSLRSSLDFVDISIKKQEGQELLIKVKPSSWKLDNLTQTVLPDTVGEYYENNNQIDYGTFQRRFEARIIRGNESLSTQIIALITYSLDYYSQLNTRMLSLKNRIANFQDFLRQELQLNELQAYDRLIQELNSVNKSIENNTSAVQDIGECVGLLSQLFEIQRKIDFRSKYSAESIEKQLIVSDSQRKGLDDVYTRQIKKREDLSYQLRKMETEDSRSFEFLAANLKNNKNELNYVLDQIIRLSTEFGIPISNNSSNDVLLKEIEAKHQVLSQEYDQLELQQRESLLMEDVLEAQAGIHKAITASKIHGDISHETIAKGRIEALVEDLALTASELDKLVQEHELYVRKKKEDLAYRNFRQEISDKVSKQNMLETLKQTIKKKKNIEAKISEYERAFSRLKVLDRPEAINIKTEIDAIDREIQTLHIKRAELGRQVDDLKRFQETQIALPSLESLIGTRAKIISALERYQSTVDIPEIYDTDVDAIEVRANITKNVLSNRRKQAMEFKLQSTKLSLEKEAHESLFERVVDRIKSDAQFSFLIDWLKNNEKQPVAILKALNQHLNEFLEIASEVQLRVKGVEDYHRDLLRLQSNQAPTALFETGGPELKRLENIFNKQLQDFYDNSIFFTYVFEGFSKIKSFNLRTNEILLEDQKGEIQAKPINAFSTGQKAFAFSIAMMSIVFSRPSDSKVLILDEFGALLDFMREDVLIKQIQLKVLDKNFADKIVIILPVRAKLDTEMDALTSQLKIATGPDVLKIQSRLNEVKSWAEQLKTRGYYQFEQDSDGKNFNRT
jgi:hypothetical protein